MKPTKSQEEASITKTVTISVDGAEVESPRDTTPGAVKLLVKPAEQVVAFDLQEINPAGKVLKTWRASQDDESIRVHENQAFRLLPNGAPFS